MVIVLFFSGMVLFFYQTICVLALIVYILNVIITFQNDLVCCTYILCFIFVSSHILLDTLQV